jgi:hypothetical protein
MGPGRIGLPDTTGRRLRGQQYVESGAGASRAMHYLTGSVRVGVNTRLDPPELV